MIWYTNTNVLKEALKYRINDKHYVSFADYEGNYAIETPINNPNSEYLDNMKSLLCNGHVLVISTFIGSWDYEHLPNQYNPAYTSELACIKCTGSEGYHAMAVVGYNDNIWYDYNQDGLQQPAEKGAFKVANSWGTDYGNSGYIWVMYDALNMISNFTSQNVNNRIGVFENYTYNYFTVKEYPLDLVAEVTLGQAARSEIILNLGISTVNVSSPNLPVYHTFLHYNTGEYNFDGGSTMSYATFVFDFYDLAHLPTIRKNYYIEVKDKFGGSDTLLSRIRLIDSTNHIVKDDVINQGVSSETKDIKYRLGVYGDINNNADISNDDATLISRYLSFQTSLSSDDLIVADVNNDSIVDIVDKSYLERYLEGIDEHLPAGLFAYLG